MDSEKYQVNQPREGWEYETLGQARSIGFLDYLNLESPEVQARTDDLQYLLLRPIMRKRSLEAKYYLGLDLKRSKIVIIKRYHIYLGQLYQQEIHKLLKAQHRVPVEQSELVQLDMSENYTLCYEAGDCNLKQLKKRMSNQDSAQYLAAFGEQFFFFLTYSLLRMVRQSEVAHGNLDLYSVVVDLDSSQSSLSLRFTDFGCVSESYKQRCAPLFRGNLLDPKNQK